MPDLVETALDQSALDAGLALASLRVLDLQSRVALGHQRVRHRRDRDEGHFGEFAGDDACAGARVRRIERLALRLLEAGAGCVDDAGADQAQDLVGTRADTDRRELHPRHQLVALHVDLLGTCDRPVGIVLPQPDRVGAIVRQVDAARHQHQLVAPEDLGRTGDRDGAIVIFHRRHVGVQHHAAS